MNRPSVVNWLNLLELMNFLYIPKKFSYQAFSSQLNKFIFLKLPFK
jgi:hypothetical protein